MKICKFAAMLLAACILLAGAALAVESMDTGREMRITVLFRDDGAALANAGFRLYRVADVDETGKATLVSPFNRYHVQLDAQGESDMAGVASALEGYILRDQIAPAYSGSTASTGTVEFSDAGKMKQGLYIVLGDRYSANDAIYTIQPSIVRLPGWNEAEARWIYDVIINAKYETVPDSNTITRKVLKVWKNTEKDKNSPQEVIVHLLCDGKVHDTVRLNAENFWRHTWEELDASCHWTVVEEELENYEVLVTREGITFVITNTYNPKKPQPTPTPPPENPSGDSKLPQTGQLWWPVPMLISIGLLLIVIGLLRRRGN